MDSNTGLVLSDVAYTRLKWITLVVLPALGALYFGFSSIWGLPKGDEVVGSLAILATFLGALLGVSTRGYNNSTAAVDGVVGANGVDPDTGMPIIGMTINKTPDELLNKKTVRLKVDRTQLPRG